MQTKNTSLSLAASKENRAAHGAKNSSRCLRALGWIVLASGSVALSPMVRCAEHLPNIIVILVLADDLDRGDYSAFGTKDIRTPNIDRLSRDGVTFDNFYANSCVCSPMRAALESRAKGKEPFFLYLAYNAPHSPIQPPPDWLAKVRQREPGISEARAQMVALIEHMDRPRQRSESRRFSPYARCLSGNWTCESFPVKTAILLRSVDPTGC